MIRVLHVLGGLNRGGAESMVMNLYRNIDREKIQFDFIIHTKEIQDYEAEIIELGGKIYRFPRFFGRNIMLVKKNWNLFFLEHPEYKLLHSHVRSYASIFIPIAKKNGVKTIVHSHSTSNGKGIVALSKAILQYPIRYSADYFLGCSKESGRWLFGNKIITSKKYFTLKNAIDLKKYSLNKNVREEYRDTLHLKGNKVFIHIGRLHPAKNHMFLLEVFKKIHEISKDTKLLIVGDGELRSDIEDRIRRLNIEESVNMLGSREDISSLLQAADCFLFPSKWEGLPVTVIEAQASGIPCFVSDRVTKEVAVSELVTFLPIDQGDKLWMNTIVNDKLERKDVTEQIVDAGFDINDSVKWIEKFYQELVTEANH